MTPADEWWHCPRCGSALIAGAEDGMRVRVCLSLECTPRSRTRSIGDVDGVPSYVHETWEVKP